MIKSNLDFVDTCLSLLSTSRENFVAEGIVTYVPIVVDKKKKWENYLLPS